jgi:nucleotide-binding universal stress UspA family protein
MVPIRRILCPVDFSEGADAALEQALFLSQGLGAEVEVVHAWETPIVIRPDLVVWIEGTAGPALAEIVKARSATAMKQLLAKLLPDQRAQVTMQVLHGPPADTIVAYAREHGHDLIVIGSHGRTGVSRWLLGSVAERVVRRATCPVLVVHGVHAHAQLPAAS